MERLLSSPALRPAFRFCTTSFTIWQRNEGPAVQLELLQPSDPLLRSNLAVLDEGTTKRNLPLKLTIQSGLMTGPEAPDQLGALRFEKSGRVADLGISWGDHIVGSLACSLDYIERLIRMLSEFECQVEWSLTTQHLTSESYAPISDLVWQPEKVPVLGVHKLAAKVTKTADSEAVTDEETADTSPSDELALLSQIAGLLKTGVKIRLL